MAQHTSDDGVYLVWEAISVLEQITFKPHEHSASEHLYTRKLHYRKRRTAGYSVWPMGGWEALWNRMAAAFGGELIAPAVVERMVVRDGAVRGVQLLANNRNRACWLGYWIAAEEPSIAGSERDMASFFATPRTGLPGFTLNFTGYDSGVSPPGEYLTCFGAAFDATEHYGDRGWYDRTFEALWLDIEEIAPGRPQLPVEEAHLVTTYGVICKPGLVGAVRPDALVRGVEGLYLTGDTTRARGIGVDKAARSGITSAEAVLGRRIDHFADTVRY